MIEKLRFSQTTRRKCEALFKNSPILLPNFRVRKVHPLSTDYHRPVACGANHTICITGPFAFAFCCLLIHYRAEQGRIFSWGAQGGPANWGQLGIDKADHNENPLQVVSWIVFGIEADEYYLY